ncbi:MAG: MBL fold metallo-hydrolase [Clostridia bacterium]|nr:MBL fold metallo-hydrolase [Clostridia bacterium]
MIKYFVNQVNPLGANCYVVYDTESKNCLIIDLGGDFYKIKRQIDDKGLTIKGVLLTHGHFDHVMGVKECCALGVPVYISYEDSQMLNSRTNMAYAFGFGEFSHTADKILTEGKTEIGGIEIEVIKTPGHTEGSVCFLIDGNLFSGDTLFALSYGRCDLPSGNYLNIKNSIINKLFKLDGKTVVLSGHGSSTTIESERKYNPINEDNY